VNRDHGFKSYRLTGVTATRMVQPTAVVLTPSKGEAMQIVEMQELVPSCHRPEIVETSELVPTCHA